MRLHFFVCKIRVIHEDGPVRQARDYTFNLLPKDAGAVGSGVSLCSNYRDMEFLSGTRTAMGV